MPQLPSIDSQLSKARSAILHIDGAGNGTQVKVALQALHQALTELTALVANADERERH